MKIKLLNMIIQFVPIVDPINHQITNFSYFFIYLFLFGELISTYFKQPIGITLTPSGRVYATSPSVKTAKKLGFLT